MNPESGITLSQALALFIDERQSSLSLGTLVYYDCAFCGIVNCLGDLRIDAIQCDDLRRYVASLEHYAVRTRAKKIICIKTFFKWLCDDANNGNGFIVRNPMRSIKLPIIIKYPKAHLKCKEPEFKSILRKPRLNHLIKVGE